jgi:hypothetical protein
MSSTSDAEFAHAVALSALVPELHSSSRGHGLPPLYSWRGPLAALAALRATSSGCRAGVNNALRALTRGLCPADAAGALQLAPLLPALQALCLTRVLRRPDLSVLAAPRHVPGAPPSPRDERDDDAPPRARVAPAWHAAL